MLSWFEPESRLSLELIAAAAIDVGGGRSHLTEQLLARGHSRPAVLDISATALAGLRARLGSRADHVRYIRSDIIHFRPDTHYRLWHDRAVLRFLREPAEQRAYAAVLGAALAPGGVAVIGTFAKNRPDRRSGLACARHDAASLVALLGADFELIDSRLHTHHTPWGVAQWFQFCVFRRADS